MSVCRSEAGRLFQILGSTTEKLLSPSRVFVLGTVRTLAWAERSWGHPESAISWQSSTSYDGAWPSSRDVREHNQYSHSLWSVSIPIPVYYYFYFYSHLNSITLSHSLPNHSQKPLRHQKQFSGRLEKNSNMQCKSNDNISATKYKHASSLVSHKTVKSCKIAVKKG